MTAADNLRLPRRPCPFLARIPVVRDHFENTGGPRKMRRKTLTLFYQRVDAGAHLSGGILAHPNRSRSIDTLWNALPRLTGPVRSPERPNGITSNKALVDRAATVFVTLKACKHCFSWLFYHRVPPSVPLYIGLLLNGNRDHPRAQPRIDV